MCCLYSVETSLQRKAKQGMGTLKGYLDRQVDTRSTCMLFADGTKSISAGLYLSHLYLLQGHNLAGLLALGSEHDPVRTLLNEVQSFVHIDRSAPVK